MEALIGTKLVWKWQEFTKRSWTYVVIIYNSCPPSWFAKSKWSDWWTWKWRICSRITSWRNPFHYGCFLVGVRCDAGVQGGMVWTNRQFPSSQLCSGCSDRKQGSQEPEPTGLDMSELWSPSRSRRERRHKHLARRFKTHRRGTLPENPLPLGMGKWKRTNRVLVRAFPRITALFWLSVCIGAA
jgi:hypothetical protein